MLSRQVKNTIEKHSMIPSGGAVLLAVSGGLDSTVMTHLIAQITKNSELKLIVCHLNHLLRGEEADRDEDFVKGLSEDLGLTCEISRVEIAKIAEKSPKLSIQQVAREARFDFFRELARKYKSDTICLAHHLDDLCENFFLRLIRGSGTMGLSSFSYVNRLDGLRIVRPLLDISREAIGAYAKDSSIKHVEDSSNLTNKYDRNKLRNSFLPLIKKDLNPGLSGTIKMVVDLIRDDEDYFKKRVDENLTDMIFSSDESHISIRLNQFSQLHVSMKSRIIRELIVRLKGDIFDISYVNIKDILLIAASKEKRKTVYLPDGLRVEKLNAVLKIFKSS